MNPPRVKLILDSGAFSAWKRGLRIGIEDYIRYAAPREHLIYLPVNLDVIPGAPGRSASQAEVDEAAKASHDNLKRMHKAGLYPMPVFHFGEDFKWLHRLLDAGETYIGIGGLVKQPAPEQRNFLDQVFSILTNTKGEALVKTHGFGVASFDLLRRYPWTTCDATSWALGAAFGAIFVPAYRNGKPDYSQPPIKLTVSEAERRAALPADHYLRYGPAMKECVHRFLEEEVQVSVQDAAVDYEPRARAIVYSMLQFQDHIGVQPFQHRRRGLLDDQSHAPCSRQPIASRGVRLVFATWTNAEYQGRILTEEDARYRLASYWELRDLPPDLLEEYVLKGKAGKRKKTKEISIPETE